MIRKMLYRYERDGGGYTVSRKKPEGKNYKVRWRLIAEEGMAITDGTTTVTAIDLLHRKDCEVWHDCELPDELKPMSPEDVLAMTENMQDEMGAVPMFPSTTEE